MGSGHQIRIHLFSNNRIWLAHIRWSANKVHQSSIAPMKTISQLMLKWWSDVNYHIINYIFCETSHCCRSRSDTEFKLSERISMVERRRKITVAAWSTATMRPLPLQLTHWLNRDHPCLSRGGPHCHLALTRFEVNYHSDENKDNSPSHRDANDGACAQTFQDLHHHIWQRHTLRISHRLLTAFTVVLSAAHLHYCGSHCHKGDP